MIWLDLDSYTKSRKKYTFIKKSDPDIKRGKVGEGYLKATFISSRLSSWICAFFKELSVFFFSHLTRLMVTSRKVLPAKKNIGRFTEAFTTWEDVLTTNILSCFFLLIFCSTMASRDPVILTFFSVTIEYQKGWLAIAKVKPLSLFISLF